MSTTHYVATCSGDNIPTSDEWDESLAAAGITAAELIYEYGKEVTIYEIALTPVKTAFRSVTFKDYDNG